MPGAKRFARIDQLLSSLGYGSRKDVDIGLKRELITVEGVERPRSDMRVDPALIRFEGEPLDHVGGLLIVLNKPLGFVCTHSDTEGPTVYEFLPPRWNFRSPKVETVGRLDKDTSGLLLLTDQHELVHRLTSPKHHVDKVYEATLEAPLPDDAIKIFAAGTLLLHGEAKPCLPAKLEKIGDLQVRLTLREGRYHQVRRMLGAVGAPVVSLRRVQFGKLTLDGIAEGTYRLVDPTLASIQDL